MQPMMLAGARQEGVILASHLNPPCHPRYYAVHFTEDGALPSVVLISANLFAHAILSHAHGTKFPVFLRLLSICATATSIAKS